MSLIIIINERSCGRDSILRGSSSGTFLSSSALYLYGDSPRPSLFAPADDSNSCIDSLRSGGEYHGGDTRESLSHMRPGSRQSSELCVCLHRSVKNYSDIFVVQEAEQDSLTFYLLDRLFPWLYQIRVYTVGCKAFVIQRSVYLTNCFGLVHFTAAQINALVLHTSALFKNSSVFFQQTFIYSPTRRA